MNAADLVAATAPCANPECAGTAEPEQDGDHRYLECVLCGHAFGWTRITPANTDTSCAVGVPEDVRRAASAAMAAAQAATAPVLLTIGRRP